MSTTPASVILSRITEIEERYDADVLARHGALRDAYDHSIEKLEAVREALRSDPPPREVLTLAVAGSLARREAASISDLDLIIVTSPPRSGEIDVEAIKAWRNDFCDRLKIDRPNATGVFQEPICRNHITQLAGRADEPYGDIAKRVLFLLESDWIYNQDDYKALLGQVADAYSEDVTRDPRKNFVFLLNDVVRYFRSLCVNYEFNKADTDDGKWPIRNVKLRHSRVLMYFSMVATIGGLSREHSAQKIDALKALIDMEPLRRMYVAYQLATDMGYFRIAGAYNSFLHLLSQQTVREELQGVGYEDRYKSPVFSQLKANSDAISAELLRFYEARRRDWDDRSSNI